MDIQDAHTTPGQHHYPPGLGELGARMIVDLRPVEFLDCATLGLLCRARRRALEHDCRLLLVCGRPWHLRILKAAGLSNIFERHATIQDALSGEL
ncbi:STAS domain-containing protein [Streptomyces aureocirculatus]|uniref:STAS domain-containing protein n=1 Tax=Streptomyces aureocirculatus TaxID=67275 RepID=UPI00099CD594|nr:STAS domain-containing protein [Streptomyces aureocirculatus]